jgi:hypothetical protein
MHTAKQQRTGSRWGAEMRRHGPVLVVLLGLLGGWQTGQAADFACGTVACLIDAITTANANGDTNTLTLAAGTYTLTALHNGTEDDPTGLPVIRSALTLRGEGAAATIIARAASAPAFRLLTVAPTGSLTLTGLTLQGGDTPGSGGGLANTGGSVTLTDCALTHNTANGSGGGLANLSSSDFLVGTVTLTNCTLAHNTAAGDGGGLFNAPSDGGGGVPVGTVTLTNCTLTANTASSGGGLANPGYIYTARMALIDSTLSANTATNVGGGIYNDGALTLTNSTLADNMTSGPGGGIYNNYYGSLTLTNTTLTTNTAGGDGGGLDNYGTLRLTNTTLTANTASGSGGGLFTSDAGFGGWTVTLTNVTLAHNTAAGDGGGLANRDFGTLTLTNATLAHNTASGSGGGIFNEYASLTLTNATLAANSAHLGGGIFNNGLLTLTHATLTANTAHGSGGGLATSDDSNAPTVQNTILARNTSSPGEDCLGIVTSLGTNLIGDPTGCTITLQSSDLTGAPGLGDFTDNSQPGNGHVPLLPTSQAIDAGNDATCPKQDQLGQRRVNIPRVGTSRCDIGAIEFQRWNNNQPNADPATTAQATP